MTTINWPATLNYLAERSSFQLVQTDPALRSEFDYGPARMRQRFTRSLAKQQLTIVLSSEEFEVFKSFWQHHLQSGVNWFNLPIFSGDVYAAHAVRIVEPPVTSYFGFRAVSVSFKMEVKRLSIWSQGTADVVGQYGAQAMLNLANIVDTTVNTHWGTTWP